jgi:hypothetical protein
MPAIRLFIMIPVAGALSACAGVSFHEEYRENALEYRATVPALLMTVDGECKVTSQIVSLPGHKRYIAFHSGLGKSVSSFDFNPGGTIAKVSVTSEGHVKDALDIGTTVLGLAGVSAAEAAAKDCAPRVIGYEIKSTEHDQITVDTTARPLIEIPWNALARAAVASP